MIPSLKSIFNRLDFSYIYAFLSELTLGLTFLFYIILARILGPEDYGIFAAATALGGILSLFIRFGLSNLITREVAANPQDGPKSTLKFLVLEILNSVPILLLLFPLANALDFKGTGLIICYLVILAEICRSAKLTIRGVFRGLGRFKTETISVSIERTMVVILAGLVLVLTKNIILVVATLVLVRILDILSLIYYLSTQTSVWSSINLKSLWESLKMAAPFALAGVLLILYYQIDLVMLKGLAPLEETGYYSVAVRTIEIFFALPRVIFLVSFTKFARCYAQEPDRLPKEIYKSTCLLVVFVLPVLIVTGFGQTFLVEIVYGKAFLASINSLLILIPSLGMKIFGNLVEIFFKSTGKEKILTPLLLSTVIINIISNAILIPYLGAVGAAIATLISEVVLAMVGLSLMIRMGYPKIGKNLIVLAILSLIVVAIPPLLLNGLQLSLGIIMMTLSIAGIVIVMRPNYFYKQVG